MIYLSAFSTWGNAKCRKLWLISYVWCNFTPNFSAAEIWFQLPFSFRMLMMCEDNCICDWNNISYVSVNAVITRHQMMHVPARGLIRGNGNIEMATRGAKLVLCGKKWNNQFEYRVNIIPHNGAFPDNGRKPPLSVILWPLEGRNLANVTQKWIYSEHSPNKCTHKVWIGLCEYFFR